jgi:hypothetical protein
MNFTDFAKRLGLPVAQLWTKGDPRRTPKGDLLAGTRDTSYCSISLEVGDTLDLAEAMASSLSLIEMAGEELKGIVQTGGTASIAIGWFCSGDAGASVPAHLVAKLAQLDLTLDFYLYFSPPT